MTEVVGRPFRPGRSGNKSGRPKMQQWMVARGREITPRLLAVLERIAFDEEAPRADRVKAACAILDRTYGKPRISVDVVSASQHTFVLRAPADAGQLTPEEWEAKWSGYDRTPHSRLALPVEHPHQEPEIIPPNPPVLGNPKPGKSLHEGSKLPTRKQGHTLMPDPTEEYSLPTDIYDAQTGMWRISGTSL